MKEWDPMNDKYILPITFSKEDPSGKAQVCRPRPQMVMGLTYRSWGLNTDNIFFFEIFFLTGQGQVTKGAGSGREPTPPDCRFHWHRFSKVNFWEILWSFFGGVLDVNLHLPFVAFMFANSQKCKNKKYYAYYSAEFSPLYGPPLYGLYNATVLCLFRVLQWDWRRRSGCGANSGNFVFRFNACKTDR